MDKYKIFSIIKIGYQLMTIDERKRALLLSFLIIFAAFIDMLSILGVMPLVTLIVEPEAIEKYSFINEYVNFIGKPTKETIVIYLSITASVLLCIALLLNILVQYQLYRFGSHCSSRLARETMQECLRAPYSWHLKQNSAVLTRMFFGDIQLWGGDFTQMLLMITQKIIVVMMAIALILYAAPLNGLFVLLIIALIVSIILSLSKPSITKLSSQQRIKSDTIVTASTQCFSGIKDIKLSSREKFFINLYANAFWSFSRARMLLSVWKHVPPTLLVFFGQIGLILIAVVLWKMKLSSGEIAANMALLVLVSSRLIPAMNRITGDLTGLWSTFPYIERLSALKNALQDLTDDSAHKNLEEVIQPIIWDKAALENIYYKYEDTNKNAIDGISLKIDFGKSYGIAGPSGSGKSTLINILLGLFAPNSGDIHIGSHTLNASNIYSWQKNIGYVPQDPFIADDTLRANVAFGVPIENIDDKRIWHCLEMANISDFCNGLEKKLDTCIGDEGARLSGGQRQRIAIARALYDQPKLLVLDEATSALDNISENAIQKAIRKLHGNVTVVIIAHRLSTIKECDEIFVLDEGIIIDSGTYEVLNKTCTLFKKLISSTQKDNPKESISN